MQERNTTWDEVRRIADELQLQIHLAGMEARDRWRVLEPRLVSLEQRIEHSAERFSQAVLDELASVGEALVELRDELTPPRHN